MRQVSRAKQNNLNFPFHFNINFQIMTTIQQIEMQELKQGLIGPLPTNADSSLAESPTTSDEMVAHEHETMRPSIRGPYRPVRNGTIRGSIFAMLASALGTGCLNLPIRVFELGIIAFVCVILLTAGLAYFGMILMERIIIKFKVVSYSEMVRKAFGQKAVKYADIVLIVYPWALAICLQVVLAKFVVQILADLVELPLYSDREREIYNWAGEVVRVGVSMLNLGLNYRHFFQTDLRQMLHSLGMFSVTGVIVCMCCIILTAFFGFTKMVGGQAVQYKSILKMDYSHVQTGLLLEGRWVSVLLQCIAGIFFTFLNHQFIFPLISHLKKPSRKRVQRIFQNVHLDQVAIYLTMALLAYLLLSQHLPSIPISSLVITSIPTLPLMLGKVMIIASLFFNLPLQIFTTREYLYQALDIDRNENNLMKLNLILVGSTFMIGLVFQQVNMYFGLIGGTAGVLMAGAIPLLCALKLLHLDNTLIAIMAYVGTMCVICFIGAIQSVIHPI